MTTISFNHSEKKRTGNKLSSQKSTLGALDVSPPFPAKLNSEQAIIVLGYTDYARYVTCSRSSCLEVHSHPQLMGKPRSKPSRLGNNYTYEYMVPFHCI